jgi:ABC-type glycerol-3-phosphate transport system substrate-binding protein
MRRNIKMRRLKKNLSYLLVLMLIVSLFVVFTTTAGKEKGAAEKPAGKMELIMPEEEVVLEFWMQDWPGGIKYMGEYIDWFQAKYPNITIEWDLVPWVELGQKIIPAIMTGKEPDIMFCYSSWLIGQDVSQLFMPLTPDIIPASEVGKYFYEELLKTDAVMGSDGEIYTPPIRGDNNGAGVVVNMDMAEAAGVDITKIRTWDDMYKATKAMTVYNADGSIKIEGINFNNYWALPQLYVDLVRQLGGDPFDYDAGRWNFDTPEGRKGIEMLDRFVEDKIWDPTSGSALEAFPKQLTASLMAGIWFIPYIWETYPDMKLDYFYIPAGNNNPVYMIPDLNFVVFSKQLSGAKKQAALLFAKHMFTPELAEINAKYDTGNYANKMFAEAWKKGSN